MRLRDLLVAAFLIVPGLAQAHPHVWVDSASEMVFDAKGRLAAIKHHWLFDEEFSAYALQGLDADRDGKYSAEELEPLAKENVESLNEFDFFTFLSVGDYQAGFAAPKDYYLELMDGRLLLHFTLPLAMPLLTRGTTHLEVGDPEYYVAFSLPNAEAVRLVDAPAACKLTVHLGREPDAAAAAALATIGAEQRDLPADMQSLAAGTENRADVNCGGALPPADASAATAAMAEGGKVEGDLTALPAASPEGAASTAANPADVPQPPASQAPPPRRGIFGAWMARIVELQTAFNRDLTAGLKGLKSGDAFWWLGGVSFLYGIVHAAGPGHGKVVISSYLVANEARVRRGVVIAFISAFVQAVVAVAIIGLMAVILNMTSMAITSTAKVFEAGSFALVALLGLYLVARKGRAAWAALRGEDAHAHHHHGHHGHDHHEHESRGRGRIEGAAHLSPLPVLPPQRGREYPNLSSAAAAVLSVGIRPCTGALVVLVFALSQGIFWAGVASTFVMALGTALTVAALAALAVGAKGVAQRLVRTDGRRGTQVMLGLELAAALLITALGAVLFAGAVLS